MIDDNIQFWNLLFKVIKILICIFFIHVVQIFSESLINLKLFSKADIRNSFTHL